MPPCLPYTGMCVRCDGLDSKVAAAVELDAMTVYGLDSEVKTR